MFQVGDRVRDSLVKCDLDLSFLEGTGFRYNRTVSVEPEGTIVEMTRGNRRFTIRLADGSFFLVKTESI